MVTRGFEDLLRLAEAQLDAARRVDGATLAALNEERRQLQASLDSGGMNSATMAALSLTERAELRGLAVRIQAADARTVACGQNVLAVLASLLPDTAPTTYGRRGQLRSA